ncbi:MAG: hypothetical protein JXA94_04215 [Parachlamydiales bacterium]|nr:hypothetical protein [Parachlamydiales bacterium]
MFSYIKIFTICFFIVLGSFNVSYAKSKNTFQKVMSKKSNKRKNNKTRSYNGKIAKTKKISSKNFNNYSINSANLENIQDLSCDIDYVMDEISHKAMVSKFGYKFLNNINRIFDVLKDIYGDVFNDLDIPVNELIKVKKGESLDIDQHTLDVQNLIQCAIATTQIDLRKVLDTSNKIVEPTLKKYSEYLIFKNYLLNQDFSKAYEFFLENENDKNLAKDLVMTALKTKNFEMAKKVAFSLKSESRKEKFLVKIAKFYCRVNDTENAEKLISSLSDQDNKMIVRLFVVDSYIRQKKIDKVQKVLFSSKDDNFKNAVKFILALYEQKFNEIENKGCLITINNKKDLIHIPTNIFTGKLLENYIEILCSSNQIEIAENILDNFYFGDEYLMDYEHETEFAFMVFNKYLDNNQIDDAKRVRDKMHRENKFIASKLIAIHLEG